MYGISIHIKKRMFHKLLQNDIIITDISSAHTPNANMAVHSVAARDELYESEASEASVFCSVNASPEKSCIVVNIWSFLFRYAYELLCF